MHEPGFEIFVTVFSIQIMNLKYILFLLQKVKTAFVCALTILMVPLVVESSRAPKVKAREKTQTFAALKEKCSSE